MPNIYVKFKEYAPLVLAIDDTVVGNNYVSLVKHNYETSFPIFRDRPKYTVDYMSQLAREAKAKLGWEWDCENYDVSVTALLHKDLEQAVGSLGFDAIPAELDVLIHELHYCLHIIQNRIEQTKRNAWLQIEWYNDSGFPLDGTDLFTSELKFGDVRLQNPFVGHGPLQMYLERDFANIPQTCKFHNFVKPGINVAIENFPIFDPIVVLNKFKKHNPEFVKHQTEEKILAYTGHPVIGKVRNLTDLQNVADAPILELEYIKFDE